MIKTPALSSSYMQGDVARFECFQVLFFIFFKKLIINLDSLD
jgi:hypothetical protein